MRVQATKKMANELNKALKGTRFDGLMEFRGDTCPPACYGISISSSWEDMEADYNYTTGKCRFIAVTYPAGYYAHPQYITTRDLIKIFRDIQFYKPIPTFEDFATEVFEQYEI